MEGDVVPPVDIIMADIAGLLFICHNLFLVNMDQQYSFAACSEYRRMMLRLRREFAPF